MMTPTYSGWLLSPEQRSQLLALFPPRYPDVVAHHVTHVFGGPALHAPLSGVIQIIGHGDDGHGVEALIVETPYGCHRASGARYHITWSINRAAGRKPVDANGLGDDRVRFFPPLPFEMQPCLFDAENRPCLP